MRGRLEYAFHRMCWSRKGCLNCVGMARNRYARLETVAEAASSHGYRGA